MIAAALVDLATIYAGLGLVIGFAFILFAVDRIDPAARGAIAFRPLLLPGCVLLWPLVLVRWIALERARRG
jgi:hypothetical protein